MASQVSTTDSTIRRGRMVHTLGTMVCVNATNGDSDELLLGDA